MPVEIERKFLVVSQDFKETSYKKIHIKQAFLNSNKHRVVRVRTTDVAAFLTIKGISSDNGLSRFEWEKEIPLHEAEELFLLCETPPIEKIRYLVEYEGHVFEVDEFLGVNMGLFLAEVELKKEGESFQTPPWIGVEVSGNKKYYNAELSRHPYTQWEK